MNNQHQANQPVTPIAQKYPTLNKYTELADIELSVVAGGLISNCEPTTKLPSDNSAKFA